MNRLRHEARGEVTLKVIVMKRSGDQYQNALMMLSVLEYFKSFCNF